MLAGIDRALFATASVLMRHPLVWSLPCRLLATLVTIRFCSQSSNHPTSASLVHAEH